MTRSTLAPMKALASSREGVGPGARAQGPLVGRRAERGELSAALAGAHAGRGALILLGGEPGIGKTRLAEAVADEAAEQGDSVLWGGAWDAGGAPAYWPWTQVIRELLRDRPAEEMAEDLGAGAPYVAQIAPEVGQRLPATDDPAPSLDSEAARFSAFDATASFIRAAAARRPIVIVLDDLHAADVATVRLLEFLARGLHRAHILAIATHRTGETPRDAELAAALADLGNTGRRLVLGGLSRDEVHELAAPQPSEAPPEQIVDRLHALTGGNPLFVDEVMRLLAAEGALSAPGALASGRLPVPDGVRATIRRRLDPLQPAVAQALTAAAVIGPEFRIETLERVLSEERTPLLGHLDEAAEAGLVEEVPRAVGRYRFAHALIRETLYEDLPRRERVALHGAVGEAIARAPGRPARRPAQRAGTPLPRGRARRRPGAGRPTTPPARASARSSRPPTSRPWTSSRTRSGRSTCSRARPSAAAAILLSMGQAEMRAGRLDAGRATLRARGRPGPRHRRLRAARPRRAGVGAVGVRHGAERREGPDPAARRGARAPARGRRRAARAAARPARRRAVLVGAGRAARAAGGGGDRHGAPGGRPRHAGVRALGRAPGHLGPGLAGALAALGRRSSTPWPSGCGNMELAMTAHSWRVSLLLELGELATVDQEIETVARGGHLPAPAARAGPVAAAALRARADRGALRRGRGAARGGHRVRRPARSRTTSSR